MRHIDLPPFWFLACGLLAWLLATYVPIQKLPLPDPIGWLAIGAGIVWAGSAVAMFMSRRTPVEPRHTPRVLLATGPFRINRNPIYSGMNAILIGWAIVLGAASAFLPAILFPIIITQRFILAEEEGLRAAFGDEAERYLSSTRRW